MRVLASTVLAIALGVVSTAHGQDAGARARARATFESRPSGPTSDPERVIAMLRDAYARRPDPRILFNLGVAQHAIGRDCDAVETFDRYLREHAAFRADMTARVRRYRAAAARRHRCARAVTQARPR